MHQQQLPDGLVPKLCGADVEFGNFVLGVKDRPQGTGHFASKALLAQIFGIPHCGRTDTFGSQNQDWGRKFLTSNGGCAYIDLHHLELCIPEVLDAYDYVAAWHAMILLARQATDAANAALHDGVHIQALANNSDGRGNSYGGHLNVLLSRRTWENIFHRRLHYMAFLASHQVSSIVVTGQGKVGAENKAPKVHYQISQRADFFETISGLQTTFNRPLVNSRDEALCGTPVYGDRGRTEPHLARLHCIFYDSNLCHVANLLKCGMMQIVLAMLEAECCNPGLILDDPLRAVVRFSHDPTLRAKAKTASGKRLTAVELQLSFLDEAREFYQRGGCDGVVPRAGEILALQADTLEKLRAGDLDAVAGRCDWVLKLRILEQAMAQQTRLTWHSPEMKHLDLAYSNIDPAGGLYWVYEKAGAVERVVHPGQIERLRHEPPEDTRAYARATLLRLAGPKHVSRVNWDSITFRLPGRAGWPTYRTLDLADPLCFTKAEIGHLLQTGQDLEEVLDALETTDSAGCISYHTWKPQSYQVCQANTFTVQVSGNTTIAVSDPDVGQNKQPSHNDTGEANDAIS